MSASRPASAPPSQEADLAPAERIDHPVRDEAPSTDIRLRLFPSATYALELVGIAVALAVLARGERVSLLHGVFVAVALLGTHHRRLHLSVVSEATWLVGRFAIAGVVALPFVLASATPAALVETFVVLVIAAMAMRAIAYALVRGLRRRGRMLERALVIGAGPTVQMFTTTVENHPEYGLRAVGIVDDSGIEASDAIGGLDDVSSLVDALNIQRVIIATPIGDRYDRIRALRHTEANGVILHVLPQVSELVPAFAAPNFDLVQGFPLYRVGPAHPSGPRWWTKRGFDVIGSAVLLFVLSPVLVLAGLGVRLSSRGPILFRQIRVGRDGRPFTMLKFRTYPADHVDEVFSLPHEASPFRWARFMRRTSLDELPQLINVIRGEMSLIGPRPERPRFADEFMAAVPGYEDRLRVAPGMSGLAQVHGLMGDTSIPERVRLDNRYVDSWSLWGDVVILLKTLPAVCRKTRV